MATPELPAVLCLSPGGLLDVDPTNLDEVHNLWAAFSRAKNCIANGERLEYLSWRLYSREIIARHRASATTSTPSTEAVADDVPSNLPELMPCSTNGDGSDFEEELPSHPRHETDKSVASRIVPHRNKSISGVSAMEYSHYRRISSHQLMDLFEHPSNLKQLSHIKLEQLRQHHPLNGAPQGSSQSNPGKLSSASTSTAKPPSTSASTSASASASTSALASAPKSNPAAATLPVSKSAVAVNAYTNKFGPEPSGSAKQRDVMHSLPHARSEVHVDTPAPMDPLRTVRGFTPSSISVSVHRNNSMFSNPSPRPGSESPQITSSRWEKATLPRNKMFFIEGDDSDSDSGPETDQKEDQKSAPAHAAAAAATAAASEDVKVPVATPIVNDGEIHEAGPVVSHESANDDDGWEDANASSFSDKSDADTGSHIGRSNDEDDDVWDDVDESSAEESEEQVQKSAEEERKRMFAERDVPLKPLIKPSLLSTLFLNKPEKVSASTLSKPRDASRTITRPGKSLLRIPGNGASTPSPEIAEHDAGVPAPVDILLGAPLAGHMPIPVSSPGTVRRDMLETELSKSLRENMEQSKAFHVEQMFRAQAHNKNLGGPSAGSSVTTLKPAEREGRRSRRQSLVASAPTRSLSRPRSRHSSTTSSGVGSSTNSRATSPMVQRNNITAPIMEYWPSNHRSSNHPQALAGERPDIPRRTTEPAVSSTVQQNPVNNTSWVNRDEDIYDPLNYHSRGW